MATTARRTWRPTSATARLQAPATTGRGDPVAPLRRHAPLSAGRQVGRSVRPGRMLGLLGYSGPDYAYKSSPQMKAIMAMVKRLAQCPQGIPRGRTFSFAAPSPNPADSA